MIHLADGSGVLHMLDKAARSPERFRRVVVSSPFLDEYGAGLLNRLFRSVGRSPKLTLVLTPGAAEKMQSQLENRPAGTEVIVRHNLHAKVYALLGFDTVDHEALVTSSNLTAAGIGRNLEVGINLRGSNERLIATIERVARRVTLT